MNLNSPVIIAPDGTSAWGRAVENNWYEASRWSPTRSFIWFPSQDSNKDLDRFTRSELSRKARYLYKNSPLIRGVIERMVTLVIGSGFRPVFRSSSPEWNKRANAVWKAKARNIHLGPRCSFSQYQRAVARARFLDGECFSILTADETVKFRTRVQGVECHLCLGGENNGKAADGLLLNSQGIVTAYKFDGVEKPYPSESVVHHFTPERLNQYRGVTCLASAINTAHDIDDILALEKQAVKEASGTKDIIETASGQLDSEMFRTLRFGSQLAPAPFGIAAGDNTNKSDYYKQKFGADYVVLNRGDKYTPYKPDRPGSAWQGFMDFLSATVCLQTGFPPSVILQVDSGGTDIRRDLDIAQRVSDPIQQDIAEELDTIVNYLMQDDVFDGDLRYGLPRDWKSKQWYFPSKVNVDRNQSQQDREDVASGLMSLEEYHARWGDDSEEVEAKIIAEAANRKEMIIASGFKDIGEFASVISLNPAFFQANNQQQSKEVKK